MYFFLERNTQQSCKVVLKCLVDHPEVNYFLITTVYSVFLFLVQRSRLPKLTF